MKLPTNRVLREEYEAGATCSELRRKYNATSHGIVWYKLKKAGAKMRPATNGFTDIWWERREKSIGGPTLDQRYKQGMSGHALSKLYGVHHSTIIRRLRALNVTIRGYENNGKKPGWTPTTREAEILCVLHEAGYPVTAIGRYFGKNYNVTTTALRHLGLTRPWGGMTGANRVDIIDADIRALRKVAA